LTFFEQFPRLAVFVISLKIFDKYRLCAQIINTRKFINQTFKWWNKNQFCCEYKKTIAYFCSRKVKHFLLGVFEGDNHLHLCSLNSASLLMSIDVAWDYISFQRASARRTRTIKQKTLQVENVWLFYYKNKLLSSCIHSKTDSCFTIWMFD
jgi:hypothetical protein